MQDILSLVLAHPFISSIAVIFGLVLIVLIVMIIANRAVTSSKITGMALFIGIVVALLILFYSFSAGNWTIEQITGYFRV